MANFNDAITKVLLREGGAQYTEIANDKGGATKYGISQAAYPNVNIRELTEAMAKDIYRMDYWNKIKGDDINSQLVAENIFDTAVNMGIGTASKLAQLCVDIPADGILGQRSINAINSLEPHTFLSYYTVAKIARYASICNKDRSQSKFLLGWINRALGAQ